MAWYCSSCQYPNGKLDVYCCQCHRRKEFSSSFSNAEISRPKRAQSRHSISARPDVVNKQTEVNQDSTSRSFTPNFPGPAFGRSRDGGLDDGQQSRSDANLTDSEVDPAESEADILETGSIPSLPGWTMGSTATDGTSALTKSGIRELIEMFQDDVELRDLLFTASKILNVERFSRNLTRLIRQYSQDLLKEAETKAKEEAALFLKQQARHISRLITETSDATSQRFMLLPDSSDVKKAKQIHLDRYLAGYRPKLIQELSSAGHEDDEEDDDSDVALGIDDQIMVLEIQELRQFFISGYPFQNFRNKLRDFLYPKTGGTVMASDGQKRDAGFSHKATGVGKVDFLRRPSIQTVAGERNFGWVPNITRHVALGFRCALELVDRPELLSPGSKRLVYRCRCGYAAYDDYVELKENALRDFARDLMSSGLFIKVNILGEARGRIVAFFTTSAPSIIYSIKTMIRQMFEGARSEEPRLPVTDDSDVPRLRHCPPEKRCKHIHLCKQQGPSSVPRLEHMHVCYCGEEQGNQDQHTNYDHIFFSALRSNFNNTRNLKEKLLFRLKQIDFVKFEALPLRSVECRGRPEMPSSQEDYEFSTAADRLSPPIGPRLMMHLYNGHQPLLRQSSLFFDRLPKKRGQPLHYTDQPRESNIGWGLDFVMTFNLRLILTLAFVLDLLFCLIFACFWSTLGHNIQDAFTIAAWISTILGVGVPTLQAWMT